MFGGLTTGTVGVLVDQPGVVLAGGFVLTGGLLAVLVGEPLARRVDHHRTERIHRDLGLH